MTYTICTPPYDETALPLAEQLETELDVVLRASGIGFHTLLMLTATDPQLPPVCAIFGGDDLLGLVEVHADNLPCVAGSEDLTRYLQGCEPLDDLPRALALEAIQKP